MSKRLNSRRLVVIISIAILALVTTLTNLGFKGSFIGYDAGATPHFPEKTLKKFAYYFWDGFHAPGDPSFLGTQSLIWFNFFALLNKIFLNPIVSQRIIYFLAIFISGFSAYYLTRTTLRLIFPKVKAMAYLYFGSLVAAVIYMFNYYTMLLFSQPNLNFQCFYLFGPLALAKIIEITEVSSLRFRHLLGLSLLLVIIFSSNIASIVIFFFVIFLYLAFFLYSKRFKGKHLIKPTCQFILLIVLLTSYIWLPILASGENPWFYTINFGEEETADSLTRILKENFLSSARFNSKISSFLNLFRLIGVMIWSSFPYYKIFRDNSGLVILSFLLPSLLLLGLATSFYKKVKRKHILFFFLSLMVIFLFLSKGLHRPFSNIYLKIYQLVPYFEMFRASYPKFIPVVIMTYSVFLGIFTYSFLVSLSKKLKKFKKIKLWIFIISFLFLSAILVHNWPFFSGKAVKETDLCIIPQDYYKVNDYLKKDKELNKIFKIPPLSGKLLSWEEDGEYHGADLDPVIFDKPILNSLWFIQNGFVTQPDPFVGFHLEESLPKIINIFDIFNVRYILLHKDSFKTRDYGVGGGFKDYQRERRTKIIKRILAKEDSVKLVLTTKNLDLYKIDDSVFSREIYVPEKIYFIEGGLSDLFYKYPFKRANEGRMLLFSTLKDVKDAFSLDKVDEFFVKGELKNRISEEELEILVKPEELHFPYVRWKPGNLIYSLVLKKEQFDKWKVRKDLEKLFENYLFYGNKRVSEMMAFNISDLKDDVLKNYKKEMEGAIDILGKMKELESEDFVSSWVKLKGILWTHQDKVEEIYGKIAVFEELNQELDELRGKPDFSKLVYHFEIPKEGEYDIFLRDENGEWSKVASREFKEGNQEFVVPLGDVGENLLDDNLRIKNYLPDSIYRISFDYQAPGGGSLFVSEGKPDKVASTTLPPTGKEFRHFEMFFKSSSGATRGDLHLSVSNVENLKVEWVYQPEIILKSINGINELMTYKEQLPKITFVKINPTKYRVLVEGAKEPYTLIFSESFHKDWKAYVNLQPSGLISPLPLSEQLPLKENIVTSYFNGEIKEGEHQNIFLNKATFETWGKKAIPEERHYLVNGYANSWYLTPEDAGGREDYELIIEFKPQRFFYIGLAVSGLTFLTCLVFLFYDVIRNARRNRKRRKDLSMGFQKLDFPF